MSKAQSGDGNFTLRTVIVAVRGFAFLHIIRNSSVQVIVVVASSCGIFTVDVVIEGDSHHGDAIVTAFFIAVAEFSIKHAFRWKVIHDGEIYANGFFEIILVVACIVHGCNAAGNCDRKFSGLGPEKTAFDVKAFSDFIVFCFAV